MKKQKLLEARNKKGFSQKEIAEKLFMNVSNYNRRETGQIKINNQEWEKLSNLLEVRVEEIYESEENNFFILKDSSVVKYLGNNYIYSIPEFLLDNQRKYIQRIEEENLELKKQLAQYTRNKKF